ncbi:hypothetical protein D3C72_2245340 [compost metagenome]
MQALQRRFAAGRTLTVIAAIGHATRNGEAMVLWLQGKFRRDKHVPDYIRTANVSIQTVTLVIRQVQLLAGEGPGPL